MADSVPEAANTTPEKPRDGEDFGAAWVSAFWDTIDGNWRTPTSSGLYVPNSWAEGIEAIDYPINAHENGMHAWHAGTMAYFARSLGVVAAPIAFVAGVLHETPIDFQSFKREANDQGPFRHPLDATGDIIANAFGLTLGSSLMIRPTLAQVSQWGNYIPGPGEPDTAFGGGGNFWGQSR